MKVRKKKDSIATNRGKVRQERETFAVLKGKREEGKRDVLHRAGEATKA